MSDIVLCAPRSVRPYNPDALHDWRPIPIIGHDAWGGGQFSVPLTVGWTYKCERCGEVGHGQ